MGSSQRSPPPVAASDTCCAVLWPGTASKEAAAAGRCYSWRPSSQPSYFPGRQATVHYGGQEVGVFGVVHPEVLEAFEVPYPVSALEVNIEPFCFDQHGKMLM